MRKRAGGPVFFDGLSVRKEDQPGQSEKRQSQTPTELITGSDNPASLRGGPQSASHTFPAIVFFVCAYLATLLVAGRLVRSHGIDLQQWMSLLAVGLATVFAVALCEGGSWNIGLGAADGAWLSDLGAGALAAGLLILSADNLVAIMATLHRWHGRGFPTVELLGLFLPAAAHEELLFRGYAYQKMRRWNRGAAVATTSVLFGLLHGGNDGVTALGMLNIFGAGVLFCLAYEWRQRLWLPISIHFFWNVLSGPVLGYAVSGYAEDRSLFITRVTGEAWASGGRFGLEGSLAVTAVEMLAIAAVWMRMRNSGRAARVEIGAQKET
jgi:membrane protease YdiL (CAAX protease family)